MRSHYEFVGWLAGLFLAWAVDAVVVFALNVRSLVAVGAIGFTAGFVFCFIGTTVGRAYDERARRTR